MATRKEDGYIITIDEEEGVFFKELKSALEEIGRLIDEETISKDDIDLFRVYIQPFIAETATKVTLDDS